MRPDQAQNDRAASARQPRRRAWLRQTALGLVGLVVCLTLSALLGVYDVSAPVRYRWQLIDRLRSAQTPGEMEQAVGPLGVLLNHPDGSWTAIAYTDSHHLGVSVAVLRTSDGRWSGSRSHHCGLFAAYNAFRRDRAVFTHESSEVYWGRLDEEVALLHRIEEEPDLNLRERLLGRLDFRPFRMNP